MELDLTIEDNRWAALDLAALATAAVAETLARLSVDTGAAELSLLFCDDARIAALNAQFRGKTGPTNVLSWPSADRSAPQDGGDPRPPAADPDGTLPLGDIALAWETCTREALAADRPLDDHLSHLIVHGTLHLLGYDHERDADATVMEELEREILGRMGVPDPYTTQ